MAKKEVTTTDFMNEETPSAAKTKRGRPAKTETEKRTYKKRANETVSVTLPKNPRAAYEMGYSLGQLSR